ncbi:DUF1552 domain-containing protein [Marinagarivorans cellulosilyticus]|uniref:Uncharacterized protein n=1 Tax=Marinagarivorans cellulosilyticus TaxID=2721545 RepID=A0AAN2BJM5_9GAMM|nr:DUF1552 domain-containing protein [Marinagarivorans cellulosilyticus]BCD97099.1 hypothetical protein MARGE09_P1299 [Marinagarivorans cellulosilyticus]
MTTSNNLRRREFIKHTAAATGAASVSTLMVQRALAQETGFKRVIFFYKPEGCEQEAFWPVNTGALQIDMNADFRNGAPESRGGSIRNYNNRNTAAATYCLQPLKRHQNDISLYSGFANKLMGTTKAHVQVVDHALTGGTPNQGSIDYHLGRAIGGDTLVKQMYTGVWAHHVLSQGPGNDFLNPRRDFQGRPSGNSNWNPVETYLQVFRNGIPAPSGGGGVDNSALLQELRSEQSVLKAMEDRLAQVKCLGGQEAYEKYSTLLQSYTQLKTDADKNIALAEAEAGNASDIQDVRFDIPNGWLNNTAGNVTNRSNYWNDSANFERLVDFSIDTTIAALALDRSRVSVLQFSGSGNNNGAIDGNHYRNFERVASNPYYQGMGNGKGIPSLEGGGVNDHTYGHAAGGDSVRRNHARTHRWYMDKLARMIDRLKEIPDGRGTMFDTTLIVHCSEFGMYNHRAHDMPYMICGNGGGAFKTGQYLDARNGNNFRNHADFFLAIAQGLGAGMNRFGESSTPYSAMLNR